MSEPANHVRVKPDAHREEIPAGLIGAGEGAERAGIPLPRKMRTLAFPSCVFRESDAKVVEGENNIGKDDISLCATYLLNQRQRTHCSPMSPAADHSPLVLHRIIVFRDRGKIILS